MLAVELERRLQVALRLLERPRAEVDLPDRGPVAGEDRTPLRAVLLGQLASRLVGALPLARGLVGAEEHAEGSAAPATVGVAEEFGHLDRLASLSERHQIEDQARAHGIPAAEVLERILLTRQARKELIEPADVAETVAFVIGPGGRSYTGSQLVMGNGWTAA